MAALFMEANPAVIVLGALLQLAFFFALATWGRWVARRNGNGGLFRIASYVPWIAFSLITIGTILGVVLLSRVFDAIKHSDPAYKATVLAQGISEAMNVSAMFLLPGYALLFFAIVTFAVGSFRRVHADARQPEAPG